MLRISIALLRDYLSGPGSLRLPVVSAGIGGEWFHWTLAALQKLPHESKTGKGEVCLAQRAPHLPKMPTSNVWKANVATFPFFILLINIMYLLCVFRCSKGCTGIQTVIQSNSSHLTLWGAGSLGLAACLRVDTVVAEGTCYGRFAQGDLREVEGPRRASWRRQGSLLYCCQCSAALLTSPCGDETAPTSAS